MISRYLFVFVMLLFATISFGQGYRKYFDFAAYSKANVQMVSEIASFGKNGEDFGFDFSTEKNVRFLGSARNRTIYSDKPFYFSINVPEGNYQVTIHYKGLPNKDYHSTVRSESRRLQVEHILVKKKKSVSRSFNVHVKSPQISKQKSVKLKAPREIEKLDWDKKLTLEFQEVNNIAGIEVKSLTDVVTVFLAGNSTVVNQEHEPWASWGQMFPRFFNTKVVIANHAESGLTLGSFLASNRLEKILSMAKPGDYLFIEFGHNDQKEKGENAGAFKSYSERLRHFVNEFRKVGGTPIIVTSTARRQFDGSGVLNYTLGDFPQAARDVAKELDVVLIDLNVMTRTFYTALGVEESKKALVHYPANTFPNQPDPLQDNTHFNTYGAYQIAKMVVQGVLSSTLPLKKDVVDFSKYDPQKPDSPNTWYWPMSINNEVQKPDGD